MRHFAVQRDGFDGAVRLEQNGAAGGFIAAARFHADVAVLHQVEAADAVLAAEDVQMGQHLGGGHFLTVQRHNIALGKFQIKILRRIRRLLRRHGPAPHAFFGLGGGVFQMAAFVADMQQIGVHRVGRAALLVLHIDRDAVLFGIRHQLLAAQQVPLAPRRDDLDVRVQRVGAQFKAHLVVAFAGGAMRDGLGRGCMGDFDQALGDQRARDGGAEQVLSFIHGVGAKHREHKIAHEFLAQILDKNVFRRDAELQRFFACRFQFFTLAEVGGEGDHFTLVSVLQPFQDD